MRFSISEDRHSDSLSQETGANCNQLPLSRAKEDLPVSLLRLALCCLFLSPAILASELNVRVVDPQSHAVPGARVLLLRSSASSSLALQMTSAEGEAVFS